jgi:hypothetical protein
MSSQLLPFDFSFCTKLLAPFGNLFTSSSNTEVSKIPNKKRDRDTIFVLPKFGLRRVLLSIEGAASDPAKVSSRGHMKVTLAEGGGIKPLQTSRGTPQSLGCSPAMPSHLGPKSPRVTNANHEIDKYAQVLKGGLLSI